MIRYYDIIQSLLNQYTEKYKAWLINNPGCIMCNYATKENCLAQLLEHDYTLEQLIEKEQWHRDKHEETQAMYRISGHYVCAEAIKEVINLIKEQDYET